MTRKLIVEIICFLFVFLFVYAAVNKMFDYQRFRVQIGQSPLLTGFGETIPWVVISIELITATLLLLPSVRQIGLYLAFSLMVMFSEYIIAILSFSYYIPCSCGGILQSMGWGEHLVFNLFFVTGALLAIIFNDRLHSPTFATRV